MPPELNLQTLSEEELTALEASIRNERYRRWTIATAKETTEQLAEQYAEAVKDSPAVDYQPGSIIGPGQKIIQDDVEYINTSGAWLSVSPKDYPLGFQRTKTPTSEDGVKPFVADEDVKPGDLREYDGVVYQAVQAHTTADHWSPNQTPSLWTKA